MTPFDFEIAIVERAADGRISIAMMAALASPHDKERACVAIARCTPEAAKAMCEGVGSALKSGITGASGER